MRAKFLALFLVFATIGCASWWQEFKTNPVQKTESILSIVEAIRDAADIAFGQIKARLPEDKQDIYQEKYDHASLALTKAMAAVRNGVAAAAEAQEENPSFQEGLNEVTEAIANIEAIVHEMRGLLAAPPSATALDTDGGVVAAASSEPVEVKVEAVDDMDSLIGSYKNRIGAE